MERKEGIGGGGFVYLLSTSLSVLRWFFRRDVGFSRGGLGGGGAEAVPGGGAVWRWIEDMPVTDGTWMGRREGGYGLFLF